MTATRIEVTMGATLNTGNFQSVRVDVGVATDAREGETVKEATDRVYDFVDGYLTAKVDAMQAEAAED